MESRFMLVTLSLSLSLSLSHTITRVHYSFPFPLFQVRDLCIHWWKGSIFFYLHVHAVFEQVTKNAVRGLWARRSKLNLVGAHINVFTGEWTQKVIFFKIVTMFEGSTFLFLREMIIYFTSWLFILHHNFFTFLIVLDKVSKSNHE